jgi:hypothetical protein
MYYTPAKGRFRGANVAMWRSIVAKKWKLGLRAFSYDKISRYCMGFIKENKDVKKYCPY